MATTVSQLRAFSQQDDGAELLRQMLQRPLSSFDPDAYHVMQQRDNALIRDELMHGAASKAFVYEFKMSGKTVAGISVVGARELASQYKGIKSRIVATVEKRGALFIFRTFSPLSIDTRVLNELADEDDFYECVVEVSDIKTGNSIEVRKKETKQERRSDGSKYDRPHYDVIAESKAFRNGVLSVLPQSVIKEFQAKCQAAGNTSAELTIHEWRAKARAHAAKNGIAIDRAALDGLTFDEISGLGAAAAHGLDAFKAAAAALGLITAAASADPQTGEVPPPPPAAAATKRQPEHQPADEWEPSAQEQERIAAQEQAEAAGAPAPAPSGRRTRAAAGPAVE